MSVGVAVPPEPRPLSLDRRAVAEALGTAFLVMAVVGSGIMADRLSVGNDGLALLANSLATGAALTALILTFGGVSGAHFNPVVSLSLVESGQMRSVDATVFVCAQVAGACVGVVCANVMFGEPPVRWSGHVRSGFPQAFSEALATFGLVATIWGCARSRRETVPFAVAAYIVAAYWFTVSTSFANPAVTIARAATDTFTGIRPRDVPVFIVAQVIGGTAAVVVMRWLAPVPPVDARVFDRAVS